METAESFFSKSQQEAIEAAISGAENASSGEIRVHIDTVCQGNVLDRAASLFESLDMHKTEERNGVLFYLAIKDHKFAVIGDAGINAKVPSNFWDDIKIKMQLKFRAGHFTEGLVEGIGMAGNHLSSHFPPRGKEDIDELDNHISFGE
jgi:uncharacterized membrane protein